LQEKTCCVIGYGEIPADRWDCVERELEREVSLALKDGYRTFLVEYRESAGALFAWQIARRRRGYPDIFLELMISQSCEELDRELLLRCSAVKPLRDISRQNYQLSVTRYLIGQADRVIAVCGERADRDTAYAIDYARTMERDLKIIKI